jgi:very-short-patch-repair endonuclease
MTLLTSIGKLICNIIVLFVFQYNCCDDNIEYSWNVFIKNNQCFNCEHKKKLKTFPQKNKDCKYKRGNGKFCKDKCFFCYDKSFASHYRSRYLSDENKIDPRFISKNSHKKIKFVCNKDNCGHNLELNPHKINQKDSWCIYCYNRKRCEDNNCIPCHNKSFASHPKSKLWHPTLNGKITPRNIALHSNDKYWMICDNINCKHTYETCPNDDTGCPYCDNKKRCDKNCIVCFNKSFASHPKSKLWHPTLNGKITPRDIALCTSNKYWMVCDKIKCKHSYQTIIADNSGCPYCHSTLICDKNINCEACFNKSFASHKMSKLWNYEKNDPIIPRDVFLNSHIKFWFTCDKNDCLRDFNISLYNINQSNQGCSNCKKKTVNKLLDFLNEYYKEKIINNKISFILEQTFDWCKNIRKLPFDFYIKEYNLIIELDGNQHFISIKKWTDLDYTQKNDVHKMKNLINNGLSIIRISQEDVWKDNINWKLELIKYIKKYKNSTVIYISKNEKLYDIHKLLLNKELTKQELKFLNKILIKKIINYL